MCGIFFYLNNEEKDFDIGYVFNQFMKLQPRGPDSSQVFIDKNLFMGFHRLAINDLSFQGNQPMFHNNIAMICNGEIYNCKEIIDKYNLTCTSQSDCETIIQLYSSLYSDVENYELDVTKIVEKLSQTLEGEFAFIIYDKERNHIIACRDRYGVRPLFIGYDPTIKKIGFASELKALDNLFDHVHQFFTSAYMVLNIDSFELFLSMYNIISEPVDDIKVDYDKVKELFIKAVSTRLLADRPICALLSGGLDSSLVCGVLSKYCIKPHNRLETFSIGLEGSIDLKYAQKVADFIQSDHHEVIVSAEEMLDAIEEVIRITETFDITSIRASIPNFLISNYIRMNSSCKVVFSGEMSDELFGSYLYFKNAPNVLEFHDESNRLLEEIMYYDNLRADRCISSNGLEARVPFSDTKFVKYIQSIDPAFKMSNDKIEKHILRKAFENDNILPYDVLYRKKCALSDGVSQKEKSWHLIIQDHIDKLVDDEEFLRESVKFTHCIPYTKEAYYYRKVFHKYYRHANVIPKYWLPKWCGDNVTDPSARELKDIYEEN
jgi:asparagine synthase (glutamine-hydrolysing)